METTELKREINQIVDHLPDELLSGLLAYLRQVEQTPPAKVQFANNFRRILDEDKELLTKLAQ